MTWEARRVAWSYRVSVTIGAALILASVVGWMSASQEDLKSPLDLLTGPRVQRATYLGFLISGVLLFVLRPGARRTGHTGRYRSFGLLALFLVTLPATWLLVDVLATNGVAAYHPAPITALCFAIAGFALTLGTLDRAAVVVGRIAATVVFMAALASILGYAYGAPKLYHGLDGATVMPLATAIGLLLLAIAIIWLRPEQGLPDLLAAESVVGAQFRALIPMVAGPPLLVGAAVAAGHGKYFEGPLAIALTSLGSVAVAGLVGALSLVILRRSDSELTLKTRALNDAHNGIAILHADGTQPTFAIVNDAFSSMTGFDDQHLRGRPLASVFAQTQDKSAVTDDVLDTAATGGTGTFDLRLRRQEGQDFWARLSLSPVVDQNGRARHQVIVLDDITEAREYEQRLSEALDASRQANAMRSTFIRLISHELRTPLNAALTWIRLMELDQDEDTRAQGMRVIEQSIDTQSRLIDDLSDASRFADAGVSLTREDGDLVRTVTDVVDELRPQIKDKLSLDYHEPSEPMLGQFDAVRIQQVVRNLLTNALKYTPEDGWMRVALVRHGDVAELTVADNGKGMTPEQCAAVFEPFWRAPSNQPGAGVGLYVVAMLVQAHDGEVSVHSDGPGTGAKFTVRLPLSSDGPAAGS